MTSGSKAFPCIEYDGWDLRTGCSVCDLVGMGGGGVHAFGGGIFSSSKTCTEKSDVGGLGSNNPKIFTAEACATRFLITQLFKP